MVSSWGYAPRLATMMVVGVGEPSNAASFFASVSKVAGQTRASMLKQPEYQKVPVPVPEAPRDAA